MRVLLRPLTSADTRYLHTEKLAGCYRLLRRTATGALHAPQLVSSPTTGPLFSSLHGSSPGSLVPHLTIAAFPAGSHALAEQGGSATGQEECVTGGHLERPVYSTTRHGWAVRACTAAVRLMADLLQTNKCCRLRGQRLSCMHTCKHLGVALAHVGVDVVVL